MDELVQNIMHADSDAIELLLNTAIKRYSELFPDWEICAISLQKNADKVKQIDEMIAILERIKSLSS